MSTIEIREAEASMLCKLIYGIPRPDRRFFIDRVVRTAGVPRQHWYNWQYALSRIPTHIKRIIEAEAHCTVFIWTQEYM